MSKASSASKLFNIAMAMVLVVGLSPFALFASAQRAYAGDANALIGACDGTNLELTIPVSNASQWWDDSWFTITYPNGSTTSYKMTSGNSNTPTLTIDGWKTIDGSSITYSKQSDNSGIYTVTLPLSSLSNQTNFTVSSGSQTATAQDLGVGSSQGQSGSGNQGGSGQQGGDQGNQGGNQGQQGGDQGNQGGDQGGSSSGSTGGTDISTLTPSTHGKIVVDGENGDWEEVPALASNSSKIPEWKLARDTDGNVYLMFDGTADTEWDYTYQWENFKITQNGQTKTIQVLNLGTEIGADLVIQNNAHHNTSAPFVVEAMIPASYFTDPNATVELVGQQVAVDDIPVVDGTDVTPDIPTTYEGIVIDGQYYDWAPVTKYPSNDVDGELQQVAMVWDGDTVYLYLEETPGTLGAYNAGTHGNGRYEIISDLDERMTFQLNADGTVSGVEGAQSRHVGSQWEISIPASALPDHLNTIGFGMYQSEPMITGVSNLNGSSGGGSFDGIVYDGLYGDWDNYPHHLIEYATAGTQENKPDAEGALYADPDSGILYGHVKVTMERHLDNGNGHEFTTGVTIKFNDDSSICFYPRNTTVDGSGNINWNPQVRDLPNGTYEFSLMSRDAWGTSSNLNNVNEHDYEFGKMYVTVSDTIDECEFYLDLSKVAEKLGMNANDFKVISAQFINIGNEWISTAGTSTLPFVGIGLGLATVAGVLGTRKLRGQKDETRNDEVAS